MFHKVVVANRGAVAARVLRCLKSLGIRTVAVYSDADRDLPYVAMADESFGIGESDPRASYLNMDRVLDVVRRSGADGLHPGYGFLSENATFARQVNATGARFIGPDPAWIDAMGHKTRARELMAQHGMPIGRSSGLLGPTDADVIAAAREVGYPVLVKPANGGGGIGMLAADDDTQLLKAVIQARSQSLRSFGSAELYLEHLIRRPRHIEFQMLADRHGNARHVFERDCSVQRRHQKVIEETAAPNVPRAEVTATAEHIAGILARLGYDVIGTVETLYDNQGHFHFLETNTRLQVEHAVTEAVTGVDLVAAQVRLAWGQRLDEVLPDDIVMQGHALEVRIYAEDSIRFLPSPGTLTTLRFPAGDGIRVESGFGQGNQITPYYDPMIGKLIVHGASRAQAIDRMQAALADTCIEGVKTNIAFIQQVLASAEFLAGDVHTGLANEVLARARPGAAAPVAA